MLDLSNKARKFLEKLPAKQYRQVAKRVFQLDRDSAPNDAKHLAGCPGYMRVDQGEYRVIYLVHDGVIKIPVINKRNDDAAYRELRRAMG